MTSRTVWRTAVFVGSLLLVGVLAGCGDGDPQCTGTQVSCNGKCVNTSSDPSNCGACGKVCDSSQSCVNGTCSCAGTTTSCSGKCVDTAKDPANCGTCGNACKTGESCDSGKCGACAAPKIVCNGACIDPLSDNSNCGTCGTTCDAASGVNCVAGQCGCGTGMTTCSGKCVNTGTDPNNCGACGTKCNSGETCDNGKCGTGTCVAPKLSCSGSCIDPQSDNNNCGACNSKCDTAAGFNCVAGTCTCIAGLTECSGKCVNTAIDGANCGKCGTNCGAGVGCVGGVCSTCPTSQILCNGKCVDPKSDPLNCSAATPPVCGIACTGGKLCTAGTCACATGSTDCSGTCADTTSDPQHCGNCTTVCGTGIPCVASKCGSCGTGQKMCGSPPQCVTVATDANNCGDCGIKCTGGMVCTSGTCACPATLPNNCTGTCVNFQTDEQHCGNCTTICPATNTCAAGTCTPSAVIAVNVSCGTQLTVPEQIEVQCKATATLQSGSTVDITADPKFTWQLGAGDCGTINFGGVAGQYKAGTLAACTGHQPTISGFYQGPPVVNSSVVQLTIVAKTITGVSIAPSAPKIPKMVGLTVNLDLMCTYNNGLTEACVGGNTAWSSSNAALPINATMGAFPAGGFTAASPAGTTTIQATWDGTTPASTATTVVTVVADSLSSINVQPATLTRSVGQTFGFKVIANFNASDTYDITELCRTSATSCVGFTGPTFPLPTTNTYVDRIIPPGDLSTTLHQWGSKANAMTPANLPETIRASFAYPAGNPKTADLLVTVTGAVLSKCYVTYEGDEAAAPVPAPATPRTKDFAKGQTGVQFKAWGYFSDSTTQDLTASVAWSSSATTIATVSGAAGHEGEANMLADGTASIIANPTALQAGVANCTFVANVKAGTLCNLYVVPMYRGRPGRRLYNALPTVGPAFNYTFNPTTYAVTLTGDAPLLPNEAGWTQQLAAMALYGTATSNPCNAGQPKFPVDVTGRASWVSTAVGGKPATLTAGATAGLYTVAPNAAAGNESRQMTVSATLTDPPASTTTASDSITVQVCGTRQPSSLQMDDVFDHNSDTTNTVNLTVGETAPTYLRAKFSDQSSGTPVACAGMPTAGYLLDITEDATNFTTSDASNVTISTTAGKRGEVKGVSTGDATVFGYLGALPSQGLNVHVGAATVTSCTITPLSSTATVTPAKTPFPAVPARVQFKATGTLSSGQTGVDVTAQVNWAQTGCTSIGLHTGLLTADAAGTCKVTATVTAGPACTPVAPAEPYVTVTNATVTGMFIQTSDKTCFDAAPVSPLVLSLNTMSDLYVCLSYSNGTRIAYDLDSRIANDDTLVTWSSATTSVATVNTLGAVTVTGTAGTSVVTATYAGTTPITTATLTVQNNATGISAIAFRSANIGAAGCALLNQTGPVVTMEACELGGTHVMYRVIGTRGTAEQDLTDMVAVQHTPSTWDTAHGSTFAAVAGYPGLFTVGVTGGHLDLATSVTIGSNPQMSTPTIQIAVTANNPNTITLSAAPGTTITGLGNKARIRTVANVPVTGGNLTLDVSNDATYAHQSSGNGGHPIVLFLYDPTATLGSTLNGWVMATAVGTTVIRSTMGPATANITFTVN